MAIDARTNQGGDAAPLVSVIILACGSRRFLDRAVDSVLRQSWTPTEIIVIHDEPASAVAEIVARHPGVRGLAHGSSSDNPGAVRNAGLRASRGQYVAFIDADDLLLPPALEIGVTRLETDPAAAFAVGSYRHVDDAGNPSGEPIRRRTPDDHYAALLRDNHIAHCATVLFRRSRLEQVGGFDAERSLDADWDLYLRIAYRFPIVSHREVVAWCRRAKCSTSEEAMLRMTDALVVLDKQQRLVRLQGPRRVARRAGLRACRHSHGGEVLKRSLTELGRADTRRAGLRGIGFVVRHVPGCLVAEPARALLRAADRAVAAAFAMLPKRARDWLAAQRRRLRLRPPLGFVRFGSLRRLTPISRIYGFDRGTPVDRPYIEAFLARHAADVRGRVLEFGDASYTRRFGGDRVTRSDVMNVEEDRPNTTFVGDLATADHLPGDAFECVILTQVLQLIYDLRGALHTIHRILKPGGVVLATMPGLTPLHGGDGTWFWQLTAASAARLFKEWFDAANLEIEIHGNVRIAVAFLHGVAAEELPASDFEYTDASYPVVITVRAVKSTEPPPGEAPTSNAPA